MSLNIFSYQFFINKICYNKLISSKLSSYVCSFLLYDIYDVYDVYDVYDISFKFLSLSLSLLLSSL